MSEHRSLQLRDIAKPGRFGASVATPGLTLAIAHPLSIVQVISRRGAATKVADTLATLKSVRVMQAGPEQHYVQATGKVESALHTELKTKLGAYASVVDQSHGRVVIVLDGPKSRAVLAKGTPVDFHADHFKHGQSAQTQMAHVGVHITRTGAEEFEISVFRGFSESLWQWLCSQAAEFGYQIK